MRLRFVLAAASLLAAACSPALADDVFTLVNNSGTTTVSFSLPGSPTISGSNSDSFYIDPVTVDINGHNQMDTVTFYTLSDLGGLATVRDSNGNLILDLEGPQLFTGSLTDPTFITGGPFALTPTDDPKYNEDFTLNIVGPTPIPEPSSLVLLGSGLLGVVGVVRRRFGAAAA